MATTNPLNIDIECYHPPSDEEQTIFDILTVYLPKDSPISPQQAAHQITSLLPDNQPDENVIDKPSRGGFLCSLWELMFRIADQLDYRGEPMQRFIMLIEAIRKTPVLFMKENYWFTDGARVWQDMPYFSMMLCERWNSMPTPESPGEAHRRAKNINGLIAHFTNKGIYQGQYRAIAMTHHALECNDGRSRKKLHLQLRKSTIAYRVPTAAIYLILCAPKLFEACKQRKCQDSEATGELWKGEPARGYSVARWEFWRSRFVVIIDHFDATEETRESCRAAIEAMDAAVGQAAH